MNQLIKEYQVNLEMINNSKCEIRGRIDDVRRVKELIESKIKSDNKIFSVPKQKIDTPSTKQASSKEDDTDSIICLDDPYQVFEEDEDKSEKSEKNAGPNLENFNDDSIIILDDDNKTKFTHSAISKGFTSQQTNLACTELKEKIESMTEAHFMEYLTKKFRNVICK